MPDKVKVKAIGGPEHGHYLDIPVNELQEGKEVVSHYPDGKDQKTTYRIKQIAIRDHNGDCLDYRSVLVSKHLTPHLVLEKILMEI